MNVALALRDDADAGVIENVIGAECNGEAKVTLERIGPNGTFAGLS
jgi:hypothetical protein